MAKQRQSAARGGPAMCAPQPNRQTKARAMWPGLLQASSLATQPAPLEANSRAVRRVLFQANSRVQMAGSPSLGLRRANWRPPLLEAQG